MYKCSKCKKKTDKSGYCKDCARSYKREWTRENTDKRRESKRKWKEKPGTKELEREYRRKYREKNKDKTKVQNYAYKRREKLVKESCEVCGDRDDLQMHHPDYNKPDWVITLCPDHHKEIHMLDKLEARS